MLCRLGLLEGDGLPGWKTAVILSLLVWMPPMLLAIAQTLLQEGYEGWTYFQDLTVYTRYLVAIVAMLVTERLADRRISLLLRQFPRAGLLEPQHHAAFSQIISRAEQQVSRPWIETLLLVLALCWSWASFYFVSTISVSGWEEWDHGGASQMSWAGIAAEFLSNPVFLFLVLRWAWRFLVWTSLLYHLSRLPLRLTALHPDRAGGLGFMSLFPGIFSGLVFALSCVISSSLLKTMSLLHLSQSLVWLAISGWVLLMMLIFFAPLTLFSGALVTLRQAGLIRYGRLAQGHHHLFEENWLSAGSNARELLGSPDPSSAADLNAVFEAVRQMRVIPVDMVSVLQVLAAALAPFLLVVFSLIPLSELLQWLLGALL